MHHRVGSGDFSTDSCPAETTPISQSSSIAIGIDIGGGTTRVGAVDLSNATVVASAHAATPAGGAPDRLEATLRELIADVASRGGAPRGRVGLAIPGIRDACGDVMLQAVNLPALANVNVRELARRAGCGEVAIESDVNAAGWAQRRAASFTDPQPARFAYLSLGTGVGGCVILDGAIVRHTRGGPGHLGHLIVDATEAAPRCRCGARGCFEAVLQTARAAGGRLDDSAIERLAPALATLLVDVAHLYAPELISVGGGAIDHAPALVTHAARRFEALHARLAPRKMRISAAPLRSDQAGVIGAALLTRVAADAPVDRPS